MGSGGDGLGIPHASSASSFGGREKPSHMNGKPSMANGGYGAALHRASFDVAQLDWGSESENSHFQPDPTLEPGSDEWAAHEPGTQV